MKKKITEKDKKDWENFLSSDVSLPNKDLNIDIKKKILTKKIDLHGFSLEEANKKIEDIIKNYYGVAANFEGERSKWGLRFLYNIQIFNLKIFYSNSSSSQEIQSQLYGLEILN